MPSIPGSFKDAEDWGRFRRRHPRADWHVLGVFARRSNVRRDTATFQTRLDAALLQKNKELIASLTPTLDQQKKTIQQTTDALNGQIVSSTSLLRGEIKKTSNSIDSNISKSGNRMISDLSRITEEVKQAEDPIHGFFLALQVPALINHSTSSKNEKMSPADEKTYNDMLAIRDKDYVGLELNSQINAFNQPTACGKDMREMLTWGYTRQLQRFFDPNDKLSVSIYVNTRNEIITITIGDCSFANTIHYRCLTRHLLSRSDTFKELPTPIDGNYGVNDASYETMLYIDSTVDKSLENGGFVQGDVDSPTLSVSVCDQHSDKESPEQMRDNVKSFPVNSPLALQIMSIPDTSKNHANPARIARTYTLSAVDIDTTPVNACTNYKYSYY